MSKPIDVICVGEILIDFIGQQRDVPIEETRDYHRYLGGSPTNVAMNMARLGLTPRLVCTTGRDGFGAYMLEKLQENGLSLASVKQLDDEPTSVIFVSQTTGTPDFIPYRKADTQITADQLPDELLAQAKIYHTTCFALSRQPARATIMDGARRAKEAGCTLSIDVNYASRVWPDRKEAIETIKTYCSYNPLVKVSEDDIARLFGDEVAQEKVFDFFHQAGVEIVCLTLGSKGVKLSHKPLGKEATRIELPAKKIDVILDATGAGDAFWSGFLFAYLQEFEMERCLKIALSLAAIKLQNVGRLPQNVDLLSELLGIS
ncbi:carbohydrate kinase family protein [Croceiramulus getboli]|nr:carbohydrate kinase [Flavobacteriaceae bacterium YJPT1-3]